MLMDANGLPTCRRVIWAVDCDVYDTPPIKIAL
jgi:hypothetical protein